MTEQNVYSDRALTSRTRILTRPFPRRIALTDIGCVFHRVRRDCLEDSAAAAGDAESHFHHIDPLIVIDLERGLGVRLLVRATRSASSTDSEFLVFGLP